MGGALTEAQDVGKNVNEEAGSLLHNQGGFSKVLPALGLGAAALGALGIANKVQAGEYGQAGLDTADLATDYVPGLGQAKMAVRPWPSTIDAVLSNPSTTPSLECRSAESCFSVLVMVWPFIVPNCVQLGTEH